MASLILEMWEKLTSFCISTNSLTRCGYSHLLYAGCRTVENKHLQDIIGPAECNMTRSELSNQNFGTTSILFSKWMCSHNNLTSNSHDVMNFQMAIWNWHFWWHTWPAVNVREPLKAILTELDFCRWDESGNRSENAWIIHENTIYLHF